MVIEWIRIQLRRFPRRRPNTTWTVEGSAGTAWPPRKSMPSVTSALAAVGIWFDEIARRTGAKSRAVVPGHTQRGGTRTAYDRVLATRFGLHAVDAAHEGDRGVMVALRGIDIIRVKLAEATAAVTTVPQERYAEAEVFFG
jgi:6-phosphofructokinase